MLHSLAKSPFVNTSGDRRYSAFLLRVEPSWSGSHPLVVPDKLKTGKKPVLNSWRTMVSKNLNTLCEEIIKMSQYITVSGVLQTIQKISEPEQEDAEILYINATTY